MLYKLQNIFSYNSFHLRDGKLPDEWAFCCCCCYRYRLVQRIPGHTPEPGLTCSYHSKPWAQSSLQRCLSLTVSQLNVLYWTLLSQPIEYVRQGVKTEIWTTYFVKRQISSLPKIRPLIQYQRLFYRCVKDQIWDPLETT